MVDLLTRPPAGWNNWIKPDADFSVDGKSISLPDAPFPTVYTPSDSFRIRSVLAHCIIPWYNCVDPLSAFIAAGGATSLIGALNGLALVASLDDIYTSIGEFSLHPSDKGGPGPRLGYCIGTEFKQQLYVRLVVQNLAGSSVLTASNIELTENSRFKRMYLHHGFLRGYRVDGNEGGDTPDEEEHILVLDYDTSNDVPLGIEVEVEGQVRIYNGDETDGYLLDIIGIKPNWELIVSPPREGQNPSPGNAYILDTVWDLEDPATIGGYSYYGRENDILGRQISSGFNLYLTDKNTPYQEGKFLGVYVWADREDVDTTTTTETTTTTTTTMQYTQPGSGSTMSDTTLETWAFLGFGNSDKSKDYSDDIRYKDTYFEGVDILDGSEDRWTKRQEALLSDYNLILESPTVSTDYIRVEISTGGYYNGRNNWHAPALRGEMIKVGDAFFKIMDHITFNIIDVSRVSIDGRVEFDPNLNQDYSIFNQYAWMINENYMQFGIGGNSDGLFMGDVESINKNIVTLNVSGDPSVLNRKPESRYADYSLIDRYKLGVPSAPEHFTAFRRFQGWRIVNDNGSEFIVDSNVENPISFPKGDFDRGGAGYQIVVTLREDPSDSLTDGDVTYLTLNEPYDVGYQLLIFDITGGGGLDPTAGPGYPITSNVLCLDGQYISPPYNIDIPTDTRFGICDGLYFGLEVDGTASDDGAQWSFVSTKKGGRSVSALYHPIRDEDWIFYEDKDIQKIFTRRGSLNFTEYPMKSLLAIGKAELTESVAGGSVIKLNDEQDYLRRIQFSPPKNDGIDRAIVFGLGSPKKTYGFMVSGDGPVDLYARRRDGVEDGDIDSAFWKNGDQNISPVYIYKRDYYSQMDTREVDIGVKVDEVENIHVVDLDLVSPSPIQDVVLQYVKSSQLISPSGFFQGINKDDGEFVFLYTANINYLKLESVYKEEDIGKWTSRSGIFLIGSFNDGSNWSAPSAYNLYSDDRNQYPLMVMEGVEFLTAIYSRSSNKISIFATCYHGRTPYLGCLTISDKNLFNLADNEEGIISCFKKDAEEPFLLWRHPFLPNSFISDKDKHWTDTPIEDGLILNETLSYPRDEFVRVMGSEVTKSQITNASSFGIVSARVLPDGTYVLFYDTEGGVKALFSSNQGSEWFESGIIWGRNGRSGFLAGKYFIFISSQGVESISTDYTHFYLARDLAEGININIEEVDLQESVDKLNHALLGSGEVDPQRLSGYVTPDGRIKVFFYDPDQLLKCVESINGSFNWTVANNF